MLQSLEEILNGILGRLRESAGQEAMKGVKDLPSPRLVVAVAQGVTGSVDEGLCPMEFKGLLWAEARGDQLGPVAALKVLIINRDEAILPPTLEGLALIELIAEVVGEAGQKPGAKARPPGPIDGAQATPVEQVHKEALGEVLRPLGVEALPTYKGIEGEPIIPAQDGQGLLGLGGIPSPRGGDHAPLGRGETPILAKLIL